jgi:tRNA(fMet)-specific endonuclease VapC
VKYLLDTNICIYIIKRRPESVIRELAKQAVGEVGISTITAAELWHGVVRSQSVERSRAALEQFMVPLVTAEFDAAAAIVYGQIRVALERQGRSIGPFDNLIAAHALTLGATLVTNNEREFQRVPGLTVVNWAAGG